MSTIVQYILVRGDLLLTEGWPLGAVIAQACHAATAAIHLFYRFLLSFLIFFLFFTKSPGNEIEKENYHLLLASNPGILIFHY